MKRTAAILLIILSSAVSCRKDILNTPPLNAVSDATVWSDPSLIQAFLNEKYKILPHFYLFTSLPSYAGYSAASDECFAKFNYENVTRITSGALTPDNLALDTWTVDYNYIRDLNLFFSKIDAAPGDDAIKTRMKGEAGFIRAFCYFDLATKYGGVPLVTKVYSALDKDFNVTRDSYEHIVDFVVSELDKAATNLPLAYDSDADLGRITRGAALALKSRMLLFAASELWNSGNADRSKWEKAAAAAKAVIDLNIYSLYQGEDYHQLFLQPANPEIIMAGRQNPINYQLYQDIMLAPNGSQGWSAYTPTQHIVDQFEMKNGKMITAAGSGYDPQHPYEGREPRFYANILYNGAPFLGRNLEYFVGGMDSPQGPVQNWNASLTSYNWKKYLDESYDFLSQVNGSKTAFIMFRLSEIYLNYAEAMNMLGNDAEARTYLNFIRTRTGVNMPPVSESGIALRDKIRHEREVELCLEGFRFFDVRRWKIAEATDNLPAAGVKITKAADGKMTYDYNYSVQPRKFLPQHYLFPIPKYELDKIKLDQNSNY